SRQLPALAPPPGRIAAAVGAVLALAKLLARRQHVDVLAVPPHEALRDALAVGRATAMVAELVDILGILLNPLGVTMGKRRCAHGKHQIRRQHPEPAGAWPPPSHSLPLACPTPWRGNTRQMRNRGLCCAHRTSLRRMLRGNATSIGSRSSAVT